MDATSLREGYAPEPKKLRSIVRSMHASKVIRSQGPFLAGADCRKNHPLLRSIFLRQKCGPLEPLEGRHSQDGPARGGAAGEDLK